MIKITNEAVSATIQLFGDIGESWFSDGWTLEKFRNELKGLNVSNLTIEAKSNGGDVYEAFAIYDDIKQLNARVTVDIVGSSASAMTIIAAAADVVRISENSRYLVHNAQSQPDKWNKEGFREIADKLESIDNQILNIYVKRTGKSKEVLAQLMTEERWMTAQEALEWGFVDEIIKTKSKITNMAKFKNLTEEEQIEFDQLKSDREALMAKVAELEAKLAEIEVANEIKEDEEIEMEVSAAIEAGKFKADAKDSMKSFAKHDRAAFRNMVSAIELPKPLKDVVNPSKTDIENDPKKRFQDALKSGKYSNNVAQARIDFEIAYGTKPNF